MDKSSSILKYLEKLSENYDEKSSRKCDPNLIHKFLSGVADTIFKGADTYCFKVRNSVSALLGSEKLGIQFLSAVHPIAGTDRAICISIMRWTEQTENEQLFGIQRIVYRIDVMEFNLTKTAGDPVDLAALRGEKIILNILDGETPEQIRQNRTFRERKKIIEKKFSKTIYPISALHSLIKLFRGYSHRNTLEDLITFELERLSTGIQWFIDNPEINHFRTRRAINHK